MPIVVPALTPAITPAVLYAGRRTGQIVIPAVSPPPLPSLHQLFSPSVGTASVSGAPFGRLTAVAAARIDPPLLTGTAVRGA